MRTLGFFRILLAVTAAGTLVLSLIPNTPQPPLDFPLLDKVEHAAAYAVLTFLSVGSFRGRSRVTVLRSILICSAYGGLIEILQGFTGRTVESADFFFDFLGAAVGGILGSLIHTDPSSP